MSCQCNDCCMDCVTKATISPTSFTRIQQVFASLMGSSMATMTLNPINVMKIRLQSNNQLAINHLVKDVYNTSGVRGFFKGTGISLLGSIPSTIIYMGVYEEAKSGLLPKCLDDDRNKVLTAIYPGIAAGIARIFTVSIISPLELVRTIRTGGSKGTVIGIANNIIQTNGVKGLYAGWLPTILRDTPYSMMYWLCFESIRNYLSDKDSKAASGGGPTQYSAHINFFSSSISGLLSATITHPFDVVKTKLQLSSESSVRSKGTLSSLVSIYKEYGCGGLYRGLSMRLATVIPAGAIMITVYEIIKHFKIN